MPAEIAERISLALSSISHARAISAAPDDAMPLGGGQG
jgi:hypothetical protein